VPISFVCPACAHALRVPAAAAGRRGKCPACGKPVDVPQPVSVPVDDDPAIGFGLADDNEEAEPVQLPPHKSFAPPPVATPTTTPQPPPVDPTTAPARPSIALDTPGQTGPIRVKVVSFDMPFFDMVWLILKWGLAAAMAAVIIGTIAAIPAACVIGAYVRHEQYVDITQSADSFRNLKDLETAIKKLRDKIERVEGEDDDLKVLNAWEDKAKEWKRDEESFKSMR
jgi:hypothetical protein